jgi:acetyl-CoA carboxylase carboxyl transferase subunit beta
LKFPDYDTSVERWRKSSGEDESMLTGRGTIMGHPLYLGLAVFKFAGASMGAVYGERVVRILEAGLKDRIPVLMVCASGGARMHEGLLSLMQMAKTSAAVARYRDAGLPYLVLHTDPTTAGVLASFASLGDVILAEPGAMVGFAGPRVAQKVQVEKPPANFQTSEFQMDSGMIDMIVPRKELRTTLARILSFTGSQVSPTFPGHGNGTGHPEQISEIEIMDVS